MLLTFIVAVITSPTWTSVLSRTISILGVANVRRCLVREEHGIIYLWYGDEEKATGNLPFLDKHVDDSYVWSEMEDHWNAHYSRCIENQLDVVHLPFVHYNTIGRGNKTLVNGPKVILKTIP